MSFSRLASTRIARSSSFGRLASTAGGGGRISCVRYPLGLLRVSLLFSTSLGGAKSFKSISLLDCGFCFGSEFLATYGSWLMSGWLCMMPRKRLMRNLLPGANPCGRGFSPSAFACFERVFRAVVGKPSHTGFALGYERLIIRIAAFPDFP